MAAFDLAGMSEALARGALAPGLWPEVLQFVAQQTGSAGAVLLPLQGNPPIFASPSMEESVNAYVNGGWHARDERYWATPKIMERGVVTDDDVMPSELRKRSPFYQEFLAPLQLDEWAGVRTGRGSLSWTLSLQRKSSQGAYSRDELQSLAAFSNKLDAIAQVSVALELAKGQAALDAFQFSQRPALLFNRSGLVARANSAAESLIGEDLQISDGRIRSRDKRATQMLDQTLHELFWKPVLSISKPVVFPKMSGGKIVFYPMRVPASLHSPINAFHAIMVIAETGTQRNFSISTLQAVFDLTPAEARLAISVGNGEDLPTYATRLGLSKATVRNHLKSVFAKVGVSRQADLAATLAGLLPDGA